MAPRLKKGISLTSYSWAELGTRYRAARLAGNESLALRIKQAIEIRRHKANGEAEDAKKVDSDTTES